MYVLHIMPNDILHAHDLYSIHTALLASMYEARASYAHTSEQHIGTPRARAYLHACLVWHN